MCVNKFNLWVKLMAKLKFKRGRKVGDWQLVEKLGAGGNGDVWKVKNKNGDEFALKVLRNIDTDTFTRFKIEENILRELNINGVIKLVDSFIPESKSEGTPWFVMRLAKSFDEYKQKVKDLDIVDDFVILGETLRELHSRNIAHRDIKPENLLHLDGRLVFTDFGLVKYPERESLTPIKRDVGAKFTMAPEMRRFASKADGKAADVYSFAKSLWIALSGEARGFDGQYVPNGILGLKNYHKDLYLKSLDDLLVIATDNDPDVRPSIHEFLVELDTWLTLNRNFEQRNLREWFEIQSSLFPLGSPEQASWTNSDSIIMVIKELSKSKSLNHMFFPDGGGHTVIDASKAHESGFIALHVSEKMVELIKPKKLTYESFGFDPSWDYFRLEADNVEPLEISNSIGYDNIAQELTEVYPGVYDNLSAWEYNEYEGKSLPDSARRVKRFLNGSFVFFCTESIYNQIRGKYDAYDAGHNKMTEFEFRQFIKSGVDYVSSKESA